jgi:hypothetical protein
VSSPTPDPPSARTARAVAEFILLVLQNADNEMER